MVKAWLVLSRDFLPVLKSRLSILTGNCGAASKGTAAGEE